MNPRIRRLQADYQEIQTAFESHPRMKLVEARGNPPESYVIELQVKGLVPDSLEITETHRAEIFLPLDYPRRPPLCRMTTPVFHPNIDPQKICIGDHWSAGQSLPHLIMRIAEMISYQSYNVKSPLNAKAAAWTEQNVETLPLEKTDLGANL